MSSVNSWLPLATCKGAEGGWWVGVRADLVLGDSFTGASSPPACLCAPYITFLPWLCAV